MNDKHVTTDSPAPQVLSKPVDLFKMLANTKPIYTKHWVKMQVDMIDEQTSISNLVELLHHANLLIGSNMSKKQLLKVRKLTARITMHISLKAANL